MKKIFAFFVVIVVLTVFSAGCTPAETEVMEVTRVVTETIEVEGEPVEVTVVVSEEVEVTRVVEVTTEAQETAEKATITVWLPDSDRWRCTADTLIPEFNEQSNTVEVNVELKASYHETVRPSLAGGLGPDIFQTDSPASAAEYAAADLLAPLDGYVETYGWDETLAPWSLALGRASDGNLYTIPAELETLILYYNKTLFEERGWEPPQTMEELTALAETIEAEGLIPFAGQGRSPVWYIGEFFSAVAGPDKVYQALTGEIPWTDPAFVESIETMNQMVQEGWFMGSSEDFLAADASIYMPAFDSGEVAMNIEGTWFWGRVRNGEYFGEESNSEWDWVPMPTVSGDTYYNIGLGSTWSVNSNTENPEAVGEFLDWYLSPEIQGKQFGVCGTTPAPVPATEEMMAGADPRMAEIFSSLNAASAAGNYGYTLWTFWPPKTYAYIQDVQKVWTGDITSEAFMAEFDSIFSDEMAAGEVPAIPPRE